MSVVNIIQPNNKAKFSVKMQMYQDLLQLSSLIVEFVHLPGQLLFSLCQFCFLWRNDFDDSIVHFDGANPLAKTLAGRRYFFHEVRIEKWIGHIFLADPFHDGLEIKYFQYMLFSIKDL